MFLHRCARARRAISFASLLFIIAHGTPANYTLTQAMTRAFTQSFDSRAAYERQIQARLSAKAAYLNLLPHISISSVLGVLSPSIAGLINLVGDLAPFLLPTRWLQAHEAGLMSAAEKQALALMRADSAAQVEGLAYALERDYGIVSRYRDFQALALKTRDNLQIVEAGGGMPVGSTDHLNSVLNTAALDLVDLDELTRRDKATIAQAMGLKAPMPLLIS